MQKWLSITRSRSPSGCASRVAGSGTCQAFSSVTRLLAHISQPGASSRSCCASTNLAYLITLRVHLTRSSHPPSAP